MSVELQKRSYLSKKSCYNFAWKTDWCLSLQFRIQSVCSSCSAIVCNQIECVRISPLQGSLCEEIDSLLQEQYYLINSWSSAPLNSWVMNEFVPLDGRIQAEVTRKNLMGKLCDVCILLKLVFTKTLVLFYIEWYDDSIMYFFIDYNFLASKFPQ